MPRHEIREVDRFVAVDSSGRRHTIITRQDFKEIVSLNKGHEGWLEGLPRHEMLNGNAVNEYEDGTLEEVRTGLKMRRVTGG